MVKFKPGSLLYTTVNGLTAAAEALQEEPYERLPTLSGTLILAAGLIERLAKELQPNPGHPMIRHQEDAKLFLVQDSDRPLYVIAEDWGKALEKWRLIIEAENPGVDPGDMEEPQGISLVAENGEWADGRGREEERLITLFRELDSELDGVALRDLLAKAKTCN